MNKQPDIRTLCGRCRADIERAGEYHIRRIYGKKEGQEKCTKCPTKFGWDYELIPKKKRGKR